MNTLADIWPVIAALFGAVTGAIALFMQWRESRANVASIYQKMATEQAEQIKTMRADLDSLTAELDELYKGVNILIQQLKDNCIEPVWTPTKQRRKHTDT